MIAPMPDPMLYFTNNGLHTHVVMPSRALKALVPDLSQYVGDDAWLQIGWGDAGYYGAAKQTLVMGARALLSPTAAILGVRCINDLSADFPKSTRLYPITLDQAAMTAALVLVSRHFKLNQSGRLTLVRERPTGELFFTSIGTYSILNTCNNWTAYVLQEAGLKISPKLTIGPGQVERNVKKNGYSSTKI